MGDEAEIKARLKFEGDEAAKEFSDVCADIEERANASGAAIGISVGRLAAGGAAILATGAAYVARIAVAQANALEESSRQTGVSIERYQTLTQGLERLGVAPRDADDALKSLNKTLGDVQSGRGAEGASAALEKMGLRSKILSGEIATADELLEGVAAGSASFGTEAEYAAGLVDILAQAGGPNLAKALADGGVALKQQEEDVRAAGDVIGEDYVNSLLRAEAQVDHFTEWAGRKITIFAGHVLAEFNRIIEAEGFWGTTKEIFGYGEGDVGARLKEGAFRQFDLSGLDGRRAKAQAEMELLPAGSDARREMERRFKDQFGLSDRIGEAPRRAFADKQAEEAAAKAEADRLKREKEAERAAVAAGREREAADRRAAAAAKLLADENSRLVESYAPLSAAADKYTKSLDEISLAEKRGLLSLEQVVDAKIDAYEKLEAAQRRVLEAELKAGGSTLMGANDNSLTWRTGFDTADLARMADKAAEDAGLKVADSFEKEGLVAVQAIAQAFGGKLGGEVNKIAGLLRGLAGDDFNSVGGPLGGSLTLLMGSKDSEQRKAINEAFRPVTEGIEKTLDGVMDKLGLAGGGAGMATAGLAGFGIGSAVGGNLESGIGGALGGMAGKALGSMIPVPGADLIGQAVGSLIGSAVGGLFAQPKKGSVTLGSSGGEFTVGAATGNSASRRQAATQMGNSVVDTLNSIAKELGAGIGSYAVSVGQRDGVFSVDPTGRGMVSKKYGAIQFDTAEEAARFAIQDAIKDGAFTGLTATEVSALRNASTLERGLEDAVLIQSVAKRLAQIDDPVGAALDALNDEFEDLRETLVRNGATVAELADAERLYNEERAQLMEASIATLREFQTSLNVGGNSPLSLTDQRAEAERLFAGFEEDIRAGRDFDQGAFTKAAQDLLDVERQINGGTAGFFEQFNRVQGLTSKAISDLENVTSIREGPFAQKTADATQRTADTTAAQLNATNQLLAQNAQIIAAIQALAGGGGGFADAANRGYVRVA